MAELTDDRPAASLADERRAAPKAGSWASLWAFLNRPVGGAHSFRGRRRERGIAMLLVVTSIAIMTAVAVDFQFNSSVDLRLAANARDELRAEYLAKSAVNMGRMVLMFQRQLDSQASGAGGILQSLGLGSGSLNFRLWELVPIDCGVLTFVLGGGASGPLHSAFRRKEKIHPQIQDREVT